jgi:hypothetical protein
MEASMRLTTIGIQFFQHDGVVVGAGWSEFDYAAADRKARESFREHYGRFFKVHPDDLGELADAGLAIEQGRVVEAKSRTRAK